MSASSAAILQIVRSECIPVEDFLKTHTAYDLLPESGKLVVIDIGITVSSAFQAFIENNITSAPLYDSRRHEYVGMLTLLDFIEIFVDFYTVIPKEDFLLCFEVVTLREWRRSKRQQKATSRTDGHDAAPAQAPLIFVHPEASLYDSSRVLLQHHIHRGPVLDTETNTVLHVFNHARILGYLVTNWRYDTRILNRTVRELNIGTFTGILTTSDSTSVVDILRILLTRKISAIPIVSNASLSSGAAAFAGAGVSIDSFSVASSSASSSFSSTSSVASASASPSSPTLIGLFSTSDVKGLMLNTLRADLEMPVREFLRRRDASEETRPIHHPSASASPFGSPAAHGTLSAPSSSAVSSPTGPYTSSVITCTRDDTLKSVLSQLVQNKIHRLVAVKENNRIDGIVSVNDILRFFTSVN